MYKVICQTPEKECGAPFVDVNANFAGQSKPRKLHGSHDEAFRCTAHYLTRHGHERIGGREFKSSATGQIVVLTKISKFGARFRTGKAAQGQQTSSRFVPQEKGRHSSMNGVIIG
jgi:hypothetical protein